jgi:hypothetical protein
VAVFSAIPFCLREYYFIWQREKNIFHFVTSSCFYIMMLCLSII